jgi:predicted glutamine amidotransferase
MAVTSHSCGMSRARPGQATMTLMCRWLACSGTPIRLEELLYEPRYSLIDQSMHSRYGVETTNGDGVGVGWYGVDAPASAEPALFRDVGPAWSDANLRELARSTVSPLFLAHIRARSPGDRREMR